MHKNNFVAVLKYNGQILREREGNCVYLPFGSEYSIFLKNLENRKASVNITIDNKNIFGDDSSSYVIGPCEKCEIERFVGDNLKSGNRFKFIKKTSQIVEHHGDHIDDGLVCIQFTFEKQQPSSYVIYHTYPYYDYRPMCRGTCWNCSRAYCPWRPSQYFYSNCVNPGNSSPKLRNTTFQAVSSESFTKCSTITKHVEPNQDEGLTVRGSISNQQFTRTSIGALEDITYTITLQLKGYVKKDKDVEKPITTREKLICPTCGLANSSNSTYCRRCGTYLI